MPTVVVTRGSVPVEILRRYAVTVNGATKGLRLGGTVTFEVDGPDFEVSVGLDWANLCVWRGAVVDGAPEAVLRVDHDDVLGGMVGRGRYFKVSPVGGSCRGEMVDSAESSRPRDPGGLSPTGLFVIAALLYAASMAVLTIVGTDSWWLLVVCVALTAASITCAVRAVTKRKRLSSV